MTAQPAQWQRTDATVTTAEIMAAAGITYRQMDVWVTRGRFHVTDPNPGHGVPRTFPADELRIARLVRRFRDAGIEIDKAFEVARALEDGVVRLGAGLVLLVEET